jgi:hypothetical protein
MKEKVINFKKNDITLINKFSKHNRINILSFDIKYLNLYLSFNF